MAFDPDAFLAQVSAAPAPAARGGFDPDAFLAGLGGPAQDFTRRHVLGNPNAALQGQAAPELVQAVTPSGAAAFGQGLFQGATFGFGDEAKGLVRALGERPGSIGGAYTAARDQARSADAAASEAHPGLFTVGQLGGGIATSFVPGLGTFGIAGKGLGAAAARGAVGGGIFGAGASEADTVGGVLQDAAGGAALGAGVGAGLNVVGRGVSRLAKGAEERIDRRLLSDLGEKATPTQRQRLSGNAKNVVEVAKEHGLDKVARDPAELLQATKGARQAVGEEIGEAYARLDAVAMGVKARDVVRALGAVKSKYANNPAQKPLAAQISKLQDDVRETWGAGARDRVPMRQVRDMVSSLQEQGFAGSQLEPSVGKVLRREAAGAVKDVLEKRFDEVAELASNIKAAPALAGRSGPLAEFAATSEAVAAIPRLNRQFGALKDIEKAAAKRANLAEFPATGLRDIAQKTAGVGLLFSGNPLGALGAIAGPQALRGVASAADRGLASLVKMAQSGAAPPAVLERAAALGIPRGVAEKIAGMAARRPEPDHLAEMR